MGAGQQPLAPGVRDGGIEMTQKKNGRGGSRRDAGRSLRNVAHAAVSGDQGHERSNNGLRIGEVRVEVLIGTDREEGAVRRSSGSTRLGAEAAIGRAILTETRQQAIALRTDPISLYVRPATCKAGEVHEIERRPVTEARQVSACCVEPGRPAERRQPFQPENRVIEIRLSRSIPETAAVVIPLVEECRDEVGRIRQQLRSQPRDLQHFEPQTHCTSP